MESFHSPEPEEGESEKSLPNPPPAAMPHRPAPDAAASPEACVSIPLPFPRLPLVVSVTGHRHLRAADRERLKERVRDVLNFLRRDWRDEQETSLIGAFWDKCRPPECLETEPEIVVLSPLAQGADQIVAEVACEMKIPLIVPLPMPLEQYLPTFEPGPDAWRDNDEVVLREAQIAQTAFSHLYAAAAYRFHVGWADCPEAPAGQKANTPENILVGPLREARANAQYAKLAAYLARNSHVLLALYDGDDRQEDETKPRSISSLAVEYMRQGLPEDFADSERENTVDPAEDGIVFHIMTPRRNAPKQDGAPPAPLIPVGTIRRLEFAAAEDVEKREPNDIAPAPDEPDWRDLSRPNKRLLGILRNLSRYNRDVTNLEQARRIPQGERGAAFSKAQGWLLSDEDAAQLPPSLSRLRDAFAYADQLAAFYQTKARRLYWLMVYLIIAASFFFGMNAHFGPAFETLMKPEALRERWWMLLLLSSLLFVGVQIVRALMRTRLAFYDRHQDYRALAEGLRVQFYWRLAGIDESAGRRYLHKQKSDLDWIRNAIRYWDIIAADIPWIPGGLRVWSDAPAAPSLPLERRLSLVESQWVQGQSDYYNGPWHTLPSGERERRHGSAERNAEKHENNERWIERLVSLYIVLSFVGALALSPLTNSLTHGFPEYRHAEHAYIHPCLILSLHFALVIAAVVHITNEKFAYSMHRKQYKRMGQIFERALIRLNKTRRRPNGESDARKLIQALGVEALTENADWLLAHRERPLEFTNA